MKKYLQIFAVFIAAVTLASCGPNLNPNHNPNPLTIHAGSVQDPFTVADVLAYTSSLAVDEQSATAIYIIGVVSSIEEPFGDSGKVSLYIAENSDAAETFYVHHARGLCNKNCIDSTAVKVGDEVIVCGKVVNYKGTTPQTVQYAAYLYSVNGKVEPSAPSPYTDFVAGEYWIMFKQADESWLVSKNCIATIDDAGSYGYVSCEAAQGTFPNLTSIAANVFTFEAVDGGFAIKDVQDGYLYQDAAGKYNNFYRTSKKASAMVWTVEQESDTEFRIESTQAKWIQYSTGYSTWGAYNSKQDNALLPYLVKVEIPAPAPEILKLATDKVVLEKEDTTVVALATINADQVSVDFDADWINYRGTNDKGFIFKVATNNADVRSTEVKISASLTLGDKTYTEDATLTIEQDGVSCVECTIADFLAQPIGYALFILTGRVQNATPLGEDRKFDLATCGNFELVDGTGHVYVYGVTATPTADGKNDKSFGTLSIREGDIITIIGTRADYNGLAQVGGPAYFVEKQSVTKISIATFNALPDDANAWYELSGVVTNGTALASHQFDLATYGNFDLVKDGADVYVRGLTTGWGGPAKAAAQTGIKEGDEISIVAHKTSWKGQIQATGAFIVRELSSK